MSFAYENEAHSSRTLQGLNQLAADHPIKAIIVGMAINIAIATGVGLAATAIAKRTNAGNTYQSAEIQK